MERLKQIARFVPDCLVLFRRLLAAPEVSRMRKATLWLAVGYLAMPFDLIPDFIPVLGQLDDAAVVWLALRGLVRSGEPDLIRSHWPGSADSFLVVLRLSGARVS